MKLVFSYWCVIPVHLWRKLLVVQYFGEADGLGRFAQPRQQTLDVHQATGVAGHDIFCARLGGGGALDLAHRGGNHRELRRERPAETAASNLGHFDQFQSADFRQQGARLRLNGEFAQAVAAVVERNFVRKRCPEIGDAELVYEKIRKFPSPSRHLPCQGFLLRAGEQLGIKLFYHRAAGTRTDDHCFGVRQLVQHGRGNGAGLGLIAGVERRLAAAGDGLRTNHAVPEAFEDFDHADAGARIKRVHEARDEKSNSHAFATGYFRRQRAWCH